MTQVEGDKHAYDLQFRPRLMMQAIQALQAAGVEPDVWKVEGLDRREEAVKVEEVARRGGRDTVGLIVLGRGAERERVEQWLKTAASVAGFIGFAVGRTSFWQSLVDVEASLPLPDGAAGDAQQISQAGLRQAKALAQRQHRLPKDRVVLTIGVPRHGRAPCLPRDPGQPTSNAKQREERCYPLVAVFPRHSRYTGRCWMRPRRVHADWGVWGMV